MVFATKSSLETQSLGEKILQALNEKNVILLFGEMGSGKTTLVQGIAKFLKMKQNIISPTFVLMRHYLLESEHNSFGFKNLFHIDLYRLDSLLDVQKLGIQEICDNKSNLVIIEWPKIGLDLLPRERLEISIQLENNHERLIQI